jgi:cell division protein FtsI/penicillin-binding protein 2
MVQVKRRRVMTSRQVMVRVLTGASCIAAGLFFQAFDNDPKSSSGEKSSAVTDQKPAVDNETSVDPNSTNASQKIGGSFQTQGYRDPREELSNERHAFKTPFGQIQWRDIEKRITVKERATFVNYKGLNLKLTIQPELQAALEKTLSTQRNIAAATVILESRTGRILAMVETRGDSRSPLVTDESILVAARAPAASLMKIVTATAAIEKNGLDPDQEIPYHGGCGTLRNRNWLRDGQSDRQHMSFSHAFGVSCNTVFARLALYETGLATLRQFAEKYMFNRPIPSDLRIETSAALMPALEMATALEVGEAGAGFGASKISPVHAAMLSAAAGNSGVLMAPYLVEAAYDAAGKQVYAATPLEISRIFSKKTADKMQRLMQETILAGTSRKYFRRKGTAGDRFEIGGKTGTLSDAEERGTLYTWFSGVAPLESPQNVAIGTVVASPKNWVVRASSLAQISLAQYLKIDRQDRKNLERISQ